MAYEHVYERPMLVEDLDAIIHPIADVDVT